MWREKRCVKKALRNCNLNKSDYILDIPCGTGVLGRTISEFSSSIIASDISGEMITLACEEYNDKAVIGFVQGDITKTPFRNGQFRCVITVGLMHRLPEDVRTLVFKEISSVSSKFIIMSFSVDSFPQKIKRWLIKKIWPNHKSAPFHTALKDMIKEIKSKGLTIKHSYSVIPFFCADSILLLEKNDN